MHIKTPLHGNFVLTNRGFKAMKHHAPMVLKPSIFGFFMVVLWHYLRDHGVYLPNADETPIVVGVSFIGVVFGISAAHVLSSVWDEYKKLAFAVIKKDLGEFLLHRDEQIPRMIHLLLGSLGILLIIMTMILNYDNVWTGRVLVFSTSFSIAILEIVCVQLDNACQSIWFKEKVPQEWLTMDVDEYHGREAEKKAASA